MNASEQHYSAVSRLCSFTANMSSAQLISHMATWSHFTSHCIYILNLQKLFRGNINTNFRVNLVWCLMFIVVSSPTTYRLCMGNSTTLNGTIVCHNWIMNATVFMISAISSTWSRLFSCCCGSNTISLWCIYWADLGWQFGCSGHSHWMIATTFWMRYHYQIANLWCAFISWLIYYNYMTIVISPPFQISNSNIQRHLQPPGHSMDNTNGVGQDNTGPSSRCPSFLFTNCTSAFPVCKYTKLHRLKWRCTHLSGMATRHFGHQDWRLKTEEDKLYRHRKRILLGFKQWRLTRLHKKWMHLSGSYLSAIKSRWIGLGFRESDS